MKRLGFLVVAAAICVSASPARAQTLEADYQVQNVFTSSVGSIGPLTVVGPAGGVAFKDDTVNGNPQKVLNIQSNNTTAPFVQSGVQTQTNPFLSASNYSVVLLANFNLSTADVVATKIFDFKNLSSDAGLYVNAANGTLAFIDGSNMIQGTGGAALSSLTYAQIVLTRDSSNNLTSVYLNGTLAFFPLPTTSVWLSSATLPCLAIRFSPCSRMTEWALAVRCYRKARKAISRACVFTMAFFRPMTSCISTRLPPNRATYLLGAVGTCVLLILRGRRHTA